MRAKLLALLVGAAMLGGVETAYADAVVSPGTQMPATPQMKAGTQTKATPAGQGARPLVLTETQMEKITAGRVGGWAGIGLLKIGAVNER
jgi:hypothetical protein